MHTAGAKAIIEFDTDFSLEEITDTQKNSTKAWIILGCAWLFYLYEYILRVSPSVMTDNLMNDFGVTSTALGVLVSFYYFSYVALQIPCGVIVDWLGPKKVITFSALLCVSGCVLFSQSETLFVAQMGRFLMGAGSACAYLSCAKVAVEWFDASKFALIAGMTMMMGTLGGTFGSRPFAILSNSLGWRSSMVLAAIVGCAIALAAWLIIQDRPDSNNKDHSLNSSTHVPLSLGEGLKVIISNPQNWLIGLYGCMMYLPLSAFAELWGVPFLMDLYGINNEEASNGSIMVFLGMALGSPLGPWLSNRCESRKKIMSGAAIGTLIIFLAVFYIPNIPLSIMFGLLFIGGVISGGQILYFACAKEINPSSISGTVIGFTNCLVMISGVIFQPLLGLLLDLSWDGKLTAEGVRIYEAYNYKVAFSVVSIALFVSWIIGKFIKESYATDPIA